MASLDPQVAVNHPPNLSPSELGTKEYWESFYDRTLSHLSSKRKPGAHPTPTPEYLSGEGYQDSSDSDHEKDIDDDDDPGTSWFSEHNAPEKVLRFLTSAEFPLSPRNTVPRSSSKSAKKKAGRKTQPSILDLGTGNGSMLALLRKRGGFRGEMVGVDYSPRSVQLARELQRLKIHSAYESDEGEGSEEEDYGSDPAEVPELEEGSEEEDVVVADNAGAVEAIPVPEGEDTEIRFEEWDILSSSEPLTRAEREARGGKALEWFPYEKGGFDIVLDKGTFDAVSLSDEVVEEGRGPEKVVQRRVCERYPGIATRLVRKGGFLVVTSCNWTEEELVRWFTGGGGREREEEGEDGLYVWGRVEYPKFRFGGQEGQGVCTVCFRRRGGGKI